MDRGNVVLVTGGGRGIGAATAKLFASRGYKVCVNYRSDAAAAERVAEDIRALGGICFPCRADIADETAVAALFKAIDDNLGTISVLVNNAGILKPQTRLENMDAERIDAILRTNVTGTILCCREAVKRMSTKHGGNGGVIVNVSSGAALTGSPGEYIDYAASKGAVDTLTRGLSLEVADEGIRVNCVRPGCIYTDMHAAGGEPGRVDRLASAIPMKRGGRPEEVAQAILWLASAEASYCTGSFIDLTGGR